MLNNINAYSHYYEFLNILGSYDIDFFEQAHPSIYGKSNINHPNFKEALIDYLKLYKKAIKAESWNNILDDLLSKKIDSCFLWTEQLHNLTSEYGYCEIPIIYGKKRNQGEGWFLCPIKSINKHYDKEILNIIKIFSEGNFQEFLFNNLGSSPSRKNDEFLIQKAQNETKEKSLFIQRILTNINPKPNFIEISEIMKKFSEVIIENSKGILQSDSDFEKIATDVIQKLDKEFHKILDRMKGEKNEKLH